MAFDKKTNSAGGNNWLPDTQRNGNQSGIHFQV